MASKVPTDDAHPEPCIRCGATRPAPLDETIEEIYVYTARLTRRATRLDFDTAEPRTLHGRVCSSCTPAMIDALTGAGKG